VGPEGKVAAFEPQRILHQMLCANLALNGLGNVHAFNNALGAKPGVGFMPSLDISSPQNFGASQVSESPQAEEVPVVVLDQLKLPNCQLIKIDVEGMELDAVLGAERIIKTHQPFIYLENSEESRCAELVQTLFDFGYDCYWHLPQFFNSDNAAGFSENVFGKLICINMLCVSRTSGLNIQGLKKLESASESWREGAMYLGG
jgi:FkbM family methyltransferase